METVTQQGSAEPQASDWWIASDGRWYPPELSTPPIRVCAGCVACGGNLVPRATPILRKRRVKFGLGWLFATLITAGIALLFYIAWPSRDEVIGVDRFMVCSACGIRQP